MRLDMHNTAYILCAILVTASQLGTPEASCVNVNNRGVPVEQWPENGTFLDGDGQFCGNLLSPFSTSSRSKRAVVPEGVNATAGLSELPFMALLGYKNERVKSGTLFSCGGSLINRRYILTAANCLNNHEPDVVVLGEHDLREKCDCDGHLGCNEPVQIIDVEKVIKHERYDKDSWQTSNDIALIRLAKPANLSVNVIPVCLPLSKSVTSENLGVGDLAGGLEGSEVTIAGWGKTNDGDKNRKSQLEVGAASPVLLHVDIPVTSNCNEAIKEINKKVEINERRQICAGKVGYDSCNGDNGGPLVMGVSSDNNIKYQLGIASFGSSRCGRGTPGVYTNVAEYVDWIRANVEP